MVPLPSSVTVTPSRFVTEEPPGYLISESPFSQIVVVTPSFTVTALLYGFGYSVVTEPSSLSVTLVSFRFSVTISPLGHFVIFAWSHSNR